MTIQGKQILMAVSFIASIFVLGIKLVTPTPINIFVEGSDVVASHIPGFYTLTDMLIVTFFACLLGISAISLLFFDSKNTPDDNLNDALSNNTSLVAGATGISVAASKVNAKIFLKVLKGNEYNIMKILLEHSEINQAELATITNTPKSTLSRILAGFEKRGVIIRYENGMSKMVKLADDFEIQKK
ncbi:MAG: helix-turn-helix transcriptional regulator [Methanosarcinaceae archaeon]